MPSSRGSIPRWSGASPCCGRRPAAGRRRRWPASAAGLRKTGAVVGWLLCDEQDAPNALVHAACAFEHARLDLSPLGELDVWSALPAAQQMGTLVRAIERHAAPCLLVLDEVDRLAPRSADLVDRLLQRGPGNFHVAAACRSNPRLDLTAHDLHGSVRVIGAEQLGAG